MKRYFFEPGAVQCYRKPNLAVRLMRSMKAHLAGGMQLCKGLLQLCLVGHPSDSIGPFVLMACMVGAAAACLGMVAGYLDFALAMGVSR